jgi:uncharacterized protein YndB with AHSA1/START domain
MPTTELHVTMPSEREVRHTRAFAAPPRVVFAALTRPDLLARWYGPTGWTLVVCEIDLCVGGAWRFVTRKPDGREIVQFGVYREIVPDRRLVKTEHWADWDVGEVLVTTELEDRDGTTTLTLTTRYPSREIRDELLAAGADRHAREHYDKLEALIVGG